ncbi:hypothetical protein Tco_0309769 [Tanacetum coccineum]
MFHAEENYNDQADDCNRFDKDESRCSILSIHRLQTLLSIPHAILICKYAFISTKQSNELQWTKDHPLEQVIDYPYKSSANSDNSLPQILRKVYVAQPEGVRDSEIHKIFSPFKEALYCLEAAQELSSSLLNANCKKALNLLKKGLLVQGEAKTTSKRSVSRQTFPEVKGWLDEDLEYYHLKELHYSAQCHTQMSLWIISRGVVLLILLMEYKFQVWYIELTSPSDHSNSRKNTRLIGMLVWGKPIQKLRQKGVYEESFSRHAAWIGGKLIQLMHTTMVPIQVKTQKIQAGIQVSRRGELRRQLQL